MSFAKLPLRKSVSIKLLLLTFIWCAIAIVAINYTLSLLWQLEGGGGVINDAGSLRMRTYRLLLLSQESESEAELNKEIFRYSEVLQGIIDGDPNRPLFLPKDDPQLLINAEKIKQRWLEEVTPEIIHNFHNREPEKRLTLNKIDHFVQQIDQLVYQIELNNTDKVERLRFYQKALLGMVFLGALIVVYCLFVLIIRPLTRLHQGIKEIKSGNFKTQMDIEREDEFGIISVGFNRMATKLSELYEGLEEEVKRKTQDLKNKNDALQSLYSVTAYLHERHELKEMCHGFVERVIRVVDADAGSVRLIYRKRKKMELMAEISLPSTIQVSETCQWLGGDCACGQFANEQQNDHQSIFPQNNNTDTLCKIEGFEQVLVIPIVNGQRKIGLLNLYFYQNRELSREENELLSTLTNQLGVAISGYRLAEKLRKMAILEERNLLAQGLHDSIAQVLSFLNLQTQMLSQALYEQKNEDAKENVISIQEGIQQCYEDVRELLLNFRMPLNKGSFIEAFYETIRRFESQVEIKVSVDMGSQNITLTPQEELEVIFILQEGLSNIRKHAKATEVNLEVNTDNGFILILSDNGIGFNEKEIEKKAIGHVGLAIMNERAQKVEGRLIISSVLDKGTTLTLTLPSK